MRRTLLLLIPFSLALGVAACGGDSQTAISSDVTDTTITTGAVGTDDMSGSSAAASAAAQGTIAPPEDAGSGANVDTTGGAVGNQLTGRVGPGREIMLQRNGEDITTLPAGTYQVTVNDQSAEENFVLVDPEERVETVTTEPEKGTVTVTVELDPGEWVYMSQPSAKYARGDFVVE